MSDQEPTRCFICGHGNAQILEEHHTVPRRLNGSDSPENTYYLCGSCHNAVESMYDDGFYERLGIAVEDVEDDAFTARDRGTEIEPKESKDRTIPPKSAHIQVEELDSCEGEAGPKHGELTNYRDVSRQREHDQSSEGFGNRGYEMRQEQYPQFYRIHCSYCHTVFERYEHSDAARHLRIAHGVENPYETGDTTFQDGPIYSDFTERLE